MSKASALFMLDESCTLGSQTRSTVVTPISVTSRSRHHHPERRTVWPRPTMSARACRLEATLVCVDPFTLPIGDQEERARILTVLDTLIALTALWAGSEWLRGGAQPVQEQAQRAGVPHRDEVVARARVGCGRNGGYVLAEPSAAPRGLGLSDG